MNTEPPQATSNLPATDPRRQPVSGPHHARHVPRILKGRSWSTWFAAAMRWLHIYVSLLGFTALLFFAVTGVTLNHPTWFGADQQRTSTFEGSVKTEWVRYVPQITGANTVESSQEEVEIDFGQTIDKLAVVEFLRSQHGIRGAVTEFRADEYECLILFKGPAYSADFQVNRESGRYTATQTVLGTVAIINDLHKGRDSGWVWSLVIDGTAILMVLVSITGIVLIFYLKRRRNSGVLTAVVGTIAFGLLYLLFVP